MADDWQADSPGTGRPWGPWATVGWTLAGVAILMTVQWIILAGVTAARLMQQPTLKLANLTALATDGTLLSLATLASTPAVVALMATLAGARLPVRDYLALRWPGAGPSALALVGLGAFLAASAALRAGLGRPPVPPTMLEAYRTSWVPLLLVALLACAPLGEEVLFRGFLYRGLADSRLGPGTAIGLSALAWALLTHAQHGLYEGATVYLMGLYLGTVRYLTRSLPLTILLHALANAATTAEVALLVGRTP